MKRPLKVTEASKSTAITDSGFSGYDCCLNPYVGCQFGCTYCYVRFFVKDPNAPWGEFVRERTFLKNRLKTDLPKYKGKRLVIGTMTDPYQPQERKARLTRAAIEYINANPGALNKVGIFTRSPIVLDDIGIISQLPRARVHFTVTPVPREAMMMMEPIAIRTEARFDTIKRLKEAGIRVHVNVAPAIPVFSTRDMVREYVERLVDAGVDEFFVDPMQAYGEAMTATDTSLATHPDWVKAKSIMLSKQQYTAWKQDYKSWWLAEWKPHLQKPTLPIWSDHIKHTWIDMRTDTPMDRHSYGDDLV